MRPMRLWSVVTDHAATPTPNDSTADPCAASAWVSIVVIGRGWFLAAARMVALDGRDNTDRTLLVGPAREGNPTSFMSGPGGAYAPPDPDMKGLGQAELGAAGGVEVGDGGTTFEVDLEVVGREIDRTGAALEAFEQRAAVGVVARAARGGADVHHVAPPGVVGRVPD